jgi:hypothetical protein
MLSAATQLGEPAASWSNLLPISLAEGSGPPQYYLLVNAGRSQPTTGQSKEVLGEPSTAYFRLWGSLVAPAACLVWNFETTTRELKPECLEAAAFLRLLEDALRSRRAALQAVISLAPQHPSRETVVVRVDVRLPAKGGKASVAIATLNCLRTPDVDDDDGLLLQHSSSTKRARASDEGCPMLQVFRALSGSISAMALSHAELNCTQRELVQAKAAAEAAVEAHLLSEKKIISGCLTLLNEKKAKIRELVDAVTSLTGELEDARKKMKEQRQITKEADAGEEPGGSSSETDCDADHHDSPTVMRQREQASSACAEDPFLVQNSEDSLLAASRADSDRKRPRSSTEDLLNL